MTPLPFRWLGDGFEPLRPRLADKQYIVDKITRMGEPPARSYLPPDGTVPDFTWLPGPYDKVHPAPYKFTEHRALLNGSATLAGPGLPYNVEAARKLLAEAGYPDGKGFPRLPLLFNTNGATRAKIVQVLQQQWKKTLNLDFETQGVEGKIYRNFLTKKDYAIAPVAWYGDYPEITTFTDKYLSTSLQNEANWINKEYDDLCDRATREGDAAKRVQLLSRAEHLLDTEVPIIPIYHYVNVTLSRDNVHGVNPNPRNLTFFKGVWVER